MFEFDKILLFYGMIVPGCVSEISCGVMGASCTWAHKKLTRTVSLTIREISDLCLRLC